MSTILAESGGEFSFSYGELPLIFYGAEDMVAGESTK